MCIYINNKWCTNASVIYGHCSASMEFKTMKCRPFHLPRKFNSVVIFAVYLLPSTKANQVLAELFNSINNLQSGHPDGVSIITGNFNQANFKTVLPKFHQHVNFTTRGENCLDHVCIIVSIIKDAYCAKPRPHFGNSDHISKLFQPTVLC